MRKHSLYLIAALMGFSTTAVQADAISDAAASSYRESDAKLRDEYRHPQQTLRFFGIEPSMTVAEISPGGGWYTDILAPLLSEDGKLIAAHFYIDDSSPNYYRNSLKSFKEKIANHPPYKNIVLSAFHPDKATDFAPAGSVDAVLTFRNVHNWYMGDDKEGVLNAFKAFYKALKPGGVLGVVDHRLPESADDSTMKSSGYMKQSYVVAMAEKAGFTLADTSEVNANALDTTQHPKGVWTLPPSLRLKDENRAHYLAIGESDRMTLKFVKPN